MTRQQAWAAAAWQAVQEVAALPREQQRDYRSLALGSPTLIQQSGLVQATAFWRTRGGEAANRLLRDLACALLPGAGDPDIKAVELLRRARSDGLPGYLALTRDATAAAQWLRRFAQSELNED